MDENVIDHPKFLALTDGAWRLWCEGQTYCQKHLTDGLISFAALKRFRYYSPARVKNLTDIHVAGKGPCWHRDERGNVSVHDYLDWNDCAADVLQKRDDSKERRQRFQDRRNAARNAFLNASGSECANASETRNALSEVKCSDLPAFEKKKGSDDLANRAGEFVERYKLLHVKLRRGAHYIGKPTFDFQEALQLVAVYDDSRLDKLAYVWLNTDHDFAQNGTRTIAKFRSMCSWCEEQLIAWESQHGPLEVAS